MKSDAADCYVQHGRVGTHGHGERRAGKPVRGARVEGVGRENEDRAALRFVSRDGNNRSAWRRMTEALGMAINLATGPDPRSQALCGEL
eukprot:2294462-Heterocapsa_arctica.AAC.1